MPFQLLNSALIIYPEVRIILCSPSLLVLECRVCKTCLCRAHYKKGGARTGRDISLCKGMKVPVLFLFCNC